MASPHESFPKPRHFAPESHSYAQWACSRCTFVNSPGLLCCEMCEFCQEHHLYTPPVLGMTVLSTPITIRMGARTAGSCCITNNYSKRQHRQDLPVIQANNGRLTVSPPPTNSVVLDKSAIIGVGLGGSNGRGTMLHLSNGRVRRVYSFSFFIGGSTAGSTQWLTFSEMRSNLLIYAHGSSSVNGSNRCFHIIFCKAN
jgi:hypothetical protein